MAPAPANAPGGSSTPSPNTARTQETKVQEVPQKNEATSPSVPEDRSEASQTEQPREATDAEQGYAIQVGAYRNKVYADTQVNTLKQRGYDAYIYKVTDAQQRSFYMVRFGDFATRQTAAEAVVDFRDKENIEAVIVRSGAM